MSQLNTLAAQIAQEAATYELRVANYFTPYGFDPQQPDFDRAKELMEEHGSELPEKVFHQTSPNLKDRVADVMKEYDERQSALKALQEAGATIELSDVDLFTYARSRVFGPISAAARTQAA